MPTDENEDEYDVNESFADLRQDKMDQMAQAAMAVKCGTCRHFYVKPPEVDIARIARVGNCGPGQQCSGGPVRGMCGLWRKRGAPTPQMESTSVCRLYEPGGPSVVGSQPAGSFQRDQVAAAEAVMAERAATAEQAAAPSNGALLVLGAVGAIAAVGPLRDLWAAWRANR